MKTVSLFNSFVDNKKINLGTIEIEDLKHKQGIRNEGDIKIISKKNKFEISKDSSAFLKNEKLKIKNNDDARIIMRKKFLKLETKVESDISSRYLINKYFGKAQIRQNKKNRKKYNDLSNKNLIELQNILEENKVRKDVLTVEEKVKIFKILNFNDTELNDLGYKKAIKYDLRNVYQYYISLLFTKLIIFQIFNKRDYNSHSIKYYYYFSIFHGVLQ